MCYFCVKTNHKISEKTERPACFYRPREDTGI